MCNSIGKYFTMESEVPQGRKMPQQSSSTVTRVSWLPISVGRLVLPNQRVDRPSVEIQLRQPLLIPRDELAEVVRRDVVLQSPADQRTAVLPDERDQRLRRNRVAGFHGQGRQFVPARVDDAARRAFPIDFGRGRRQRGKVDLRDRRRLPL